MAKLTAFLSPAIIWKYSSLPLAAILLIFMALNSPVWYDDACHYLALRGIMLSGELSFPTQAQGSMVMGHTTLLHPFSQYITVGPAVNLPAVAWLKLLDTNSMLAARLMIVAYSVLTLAALYLLALSTLGSAAKARWAPLFLLLNIQFLTYGSQYLGEVPGLAWLLLCLLATHMALKKKSVLLAVLAGLAGSMSILCKEYIGLALALGFGLAALWLFRRQRRAALVLLLAAACMPLGSLLYYVHYFGSTDSVLQYWQVRSAYSAEFLHGGWEPWRFLLGKPHIVLGTAALGMRVMYRPSALATLLLTLQAMLLLHFVLGTGYDRFALWVMPLPALALAEWLQAVWRRAVHDVLPSRRRWKLLGIGLGIMVFVGQRTPLRLIELAVNPPNTHEKEVNRQLLAHGVRNIYTAELMLIPFLDDSIAWAVPLEPPCRARYQAPPSLRPSVCLVEGDYARTEYRWKYTTQLLPLAKEVNPSLPLLPHSKVEGALGPYWLYIAGR